MAFVERRAGGVGVRRGAARRTAACDPGARATRRAIQDASRFFWPSVADFGTKSRICLIERPPNRSSCHDNCARPSIIPQAHYRCAVRRALPLGARGGPPPPGSGCLVLLPARCVRHMPCRRRVDQEISAPVADFIAVYESCTERTCDPSDPARAEMRAEARLRRGAVLFRHLPAARSRGRMRSERPPNNPRRIGSSADPVRWRSHVGRFASADAHHSIRSSVRNPAILAECNRIRGVSRGLAPRTVPAMERSFPGPNRAVMFP